MSALRRLVRRFGHDLVPLRKPRAAGAQLVRVLEHAGVTCVFDVGANSGQYALRLRRDGYRGRIVSYEPQPRVHATLTARARGDPGWTVAPPIALGESDGDATLEVSVESDMSSLRAQTELLRRVSPTSRVLERVTVPLRRLDRVAAEVLAADDRPFLKIDTQGYEAQVLAGAAGLVPRLVGIQLELALVPIYQGEPDFRAQLDTLAGMGFTLALILPGYFERKIARQLQVDGVFVRAP